MGYTTTQHFVYTIMGLIMLGVFLVTIRAEIAYLKASRDKKGQFTLSILSMVILIYLTLVWLLHWGLSPVFVVTTTMLAVPLLIILAPIILWLRTRSFKRLINEKKKEQEKLLKEVKEILDERKREKIRQGKIDRGEPVD